jgi:hypothetical protein
MQFVMQIVVCVGIALGDGPGESEDYGPATW